MRLSDKRGLSFWEQLDRIQLTLGVSDRHFADLLGLTLAQFERYRKIKKILSIYAIQPLLDHINVSLDAFLNGRIDFKALAAQVNGIPAIPERYLKCAHSRRRTSVDVLNYMEMFFGWRSVQTLLQEFQVPAAAFNDLDAFIGLQFLSDVCSYLKRRNYSDSMLYEMGKFSSYVNGNSPFARELGKSKTPKDLYDLQVNHMMGHFDTNYKYRTTKLTDEFCIIEAKENKDIAAELGVRHLGNAPVCSTKSGRASAVLTFMGLPPASVVETHCIHRGDANCMWKVDYALARYRQIHAH